MTVSLFFIGGHTGREAKINQQPIITLANYLYNNIFLYLTT